MDVGGAVDGREHIVERLAHAEINGRSGSAAICQRDLSELGNSLSAAKVAQQNRVDTGDERIPRERISGCCRIEPQLMGDRAAVDVRDGKSVGAPAPRVVGQHDATIGNRGRQFATVVGGVIDVFDDVIERRSTVQIDGKRGGRGVGQLDLKIGLIRGRSRI